MAANEQTGQPSADRHVPARNHAYGDDDDRERGGRDEHAHVVPGAGGFLLATLLVDQRCILGNYLGRERQVVEHVQHVVDGGSLGVERHAPRVVRQVDRHVLDAWQGTVVLLYVGRTVRAVHAVYG